MSGDLDLEQRYRRVLRVLPGYYRDKWEEDMVAAFLDSWMTGDPDEDSVARTRDEEDQEQCRSSSGRARRPSWPACSLRALCSPSLAAA